MLKHQLVSKMCLEKYGCELRYLYQQRSDWIEIKDLLNNEVKTKIQDMYDQGLIQIMKVSEYLKGLEE